MTPGSVAPRTARSVRPVSQLQPDQPVEIYFFLITFQYGPMQHPAVQPISFLVLSTFSSDSPGSLSLSPKSPTHKSNYNSSMHCNCNKTTCSSALNTYFHLYHSCLEPYRLHLLNLSSNTVHRHLNLVGPCDICPGCARALHRLASVAQLLCF